MTPLADKIRPERLEDIIGQAHILGQDKILNRIVKYNVVPNMIFYGPPGVGKTSVANVIAKSTDKNFYKINATNSSLEDIKKIIRELDNLINANGVLLYLDEIQNFNKRQQQSLLEFIEDGRITLIASTTENPYHYVYKAILSRSTIFEFKPLNTKDIVKGLNRALDIVQKDLKNIKIDYDEEALKYIAEVSKGDLRRSINALELCIYAYEPDDTGVIYINLDKAKESTQCKMINFDKDGDSHYDILSAFQKSIRGSDVNASLHYLARLIKGGDLISICRRLLVIASEDIGMAYPNAIVIVKNCVDAAMQLGFPEARIPLSEAVIILATSPKSNSCLKAIDEALYDIENKNIGDIPNYLKDSHYNGAKKLERGIGYKYPHDYENNYVYQKYLPENIKTAQYYKPGNNKFENKIKEYWNIVKKGED